MEVEEKKAKGTMCIKEDADRRLFACNKYYENSRKPDRNQTFYMSRILRVYEF